MPTNREICSDIIGYLRAHNIDDRVSYRLILNLLRNKAKLLIKQDADNRRIFKQKNLFKPINCVELEEVNLVECDFDICFTSIKKSKMKLPETYNTMYGDFIIITNLEGGGKFKQINQEEYETVKSRPFFDKSITYYWINSGYLYIPDSTLIAVRVKGFFKNQEEYSKITGNSCVPILEQEFNCPDYLEDVVKNAVKKDLLESLKNINQDEKPNLNNNEK